MSIRARGRMAEPRLGSRGAAVGVLLAAALALSLAAHGRALLAREGRSPARPAAAGVVPNAAARPTPRVAQADPPYGGDAFPQGEGGEPASREGARGNRTREPLSGREPEEEGSWQAPPRDEVGTSLPWEPSRPPAGDWRERVRRRPAPIPPSRPLPYYPPEPPPTAPPGSAVLGPPDFVGSAAGYLEIPVGQTATLLAPGCRDASLRESRVATVVAREPDRVLIRGIFPGRTLLDVEGERGRSTFIVQVR